MSSIEWTDETWNPVVGCDKVSPGCAHCYAETMAKRLKGMALGDIAAGIDPGRKRHYIDAIDDKGHWSGKLIPAPESLADPLRWKKPRMVFVNSMSDLFHESASSEYIAAVFGVMAASPQHTFQILTKRAERMRNWCSVIQSCGGIGKYIRSELGMAALRGFFDAVVKVDTVDGKQQRSLDDPWMQVMNGAACNFGPTPLSNVWLGVSCEDQKRADERIPWLLKTPAAVRFVSAEPLLSTVDLGLRNWADLGRDDCRLDWVIVGGESGPCARACNLANIRLIVEDCQAANVPCFVKQMGSLAITRYYDDRTREWYEQNGWDWPEPIDWALRDGQPPLSARVQIKHKDKKGGDPEEWPHDLRVRQWPEVDRA